MRADEIRRTFLDFFAQRGHHVAPSASLIPTDPNLLLTIAGMVPFLPYFLGDVPVEHPRIVSDQKCVRTNDIENVGLTSRHLTFFEMLGNFSFGDYFKTEAIRWAWELATQHYGFQRERLWVTVFETDDQAADIWLAETDLDPAHLQRLGHEDNYWWTGAAGPGGPDSEMFFDRGPEHGLDGGPAVDESRYVEFFNLVFTQEQVDGSGRKVADLPRKNVDTGMGFERMAMLLQDVENVYDTDAIRPILDRAADVTGAAYGAGTAEGERHDVSLRVIADHMRSGAMLIGDGVLPSNEGRGYVLRRLLRRVVRHARLLGHEGPVMAPLVESVVQTLGGAWPELTAQRQLIDGITANEEERFTATLRSGLKLLDEAVETAKADGADALTGATAFVLHDTYGFPVDLTVEIARERGLDLDRDAFARFMEGQRTRARAAAQGARGAQGASADAYREAAERTGATEFVGYTAAETETRLGGLLVHGVVDEAAQEGDEVELVLPRTPFYAEGGGQLGDHGLVTTATGRIAITDTLRPVEGVHVHRGRILAGEVRAGQEARATIDQARRDAITKGHTATHILHATLRELLGEHASQAGSAIDAGRFRFDFPSFEAPSRDLLQEVEGRVNARVGADDPVVATETNLAEARAMGAMALFGEKYGDRVRVVRTGAYSLELCGGTHVDRTAEVGVFTILSEQSISANVRRIEAATGPAALAFLAAQRTVAEEVARLVKAPADQVVERVGGLLDRVRELERALAHEREQAVLGAADDLVAGAEDHGGARLVVGRVEQADGEALKALASDVRNRLGPAVVVLGSASVEGAASLIALTTGTELAARDVLQPAARIVGGGAGGKGDTARAGGRQGARLDEALEAARLEARRLLAQAA